jgi:hypothetical protein
MTNKSKTPAHLPESLQRSIRHHRRIRFPIVIRHQSQSPQGGGHRVGLTSRRIDQVQCVSAESSPDTN